MLVRSGNDQGWIYFKNGEIVHAETNGLQGEDALYRVLSWELGVFECDQVSAASQTIRENWDYLLMESLRRRDSLDA